MMVTLTESKAVKVKSSCENLLHQRTATIRTIYKVIGFLVSSFPAVEFAEMHYRHLELDTICALRESKGNCDAIMTLSPSSRIELTWWINNVTHASKAISHGNPNLTLSTEASNVGWGAVCGNTIQRNIWLSATHIPGSENIEANKVSRALSFSHDNFSIFSQSF